ncbi:MAG: phosphoenolpyruvate carboxykinase (GTP), partial [Nitrospinae bacterium]|nr:phosphoenolpyruvate carboxykinase (GTP) [Nitrospinota bacterium]
LPRSTLEEILHVDRAEWTSEVEEQRKFFEQFGDRLPKEIWEESKQLAKRLS